MQNLAKENIPSILSAFLEPIDVNEFTSPDFFYVPYESVTEGESGKVSDKIIKDTFGELVKIKNKGKIRVEGDLEEKVNDIVTSQQLAEHVFDHAVQFSPTSDKQQGGLIFMEGNYEALYCILGTWYKMRKEMLPMELVKILIAPRTLHSFKFYFIRSLKRVTAATSRKDTEPFNRPHVIKRREHLDLQRDIRWELVDSGKNFETFKQSLPPLFLKETVPDEVKEHIRIARRILEQSYFVYEFIDVAFTQIIIGFEKALKHRYLQFTGKDGEDEKFYNLIEWAFLNNLLETESKETVHGYRVVRNGKVHSSKNTLGGFAYLQKLIEPVMCINDLYEDAALRLQRKTDGKRLVGDIKTRFKDGAILEYNNQSYMILEVYLLFINNKNNKRSTHFCLIPAIDLTPIERGQQFTTEVAHIILEHYDMLEDRFTFKAADGNPVILRTPMDTEAAMIEFWRNKIETLGDSGKVVLATTPHQIGQYFISALDHFHRS